MECYNIDTSYTEYSNNEVFKMIKMILSNEVKEINTSYERLLSISHLILYITDDNLLNSTIRLLKESILLINEKQIEKPLYNVLKNLIYSEKDCTRIRAFVYSNLLIYEVKINHWKDSFKDDFPELRFKMDGRNLYINNNDIDIVLKKNIVNYVVNDVIEILEPQNQIKEFKKFIKSMAHVDYSNDTNYFKSDIKYLSILKENIQKNNKKIEINTELNENPHPRIFINYRAYNLFETLKDSIVKNDLADYSFIFRRMIKDELIHTSIKESEFRKWLNKHYNIELDKLKLLDYCKTDLKENLYCELAHNFKSN